MKNKFYIMTALVISLTGCSNIEDGTQPTGNFPEDHIIRIVTEVNAPVSRAGYDASNLESFGLIIHNSENIAYDYNSQMVKSNNDWNTADGRTDHGTSGRRRDVLPAGRGKAKKKPRPGIA